MFVSGDLCPGLHGSPSFNTISISSLQSLPKSILSCEPRIAKQDDHWAPMLSTATDLGEAKSFLMNTTTTCSTFHTHTPQLPTHLGGQS